jgi:hypothetical protein
MHRIPDEIIGHNNRWRALRPDGDPVSRPFLLRWYVGGVKHKWGNAYLHQFIRNDEDRALHDHPWWNLSVLLGGQYIEHTVEAGGVHMRQLYRIGDVKLRSPGAAHRVELTGQFIDADGRSVILGDCPVRPPNLPEWCEADQFKAPSWSLFLTGPVQRPWGFHCPRDGWRDSHEFHERGGCQ